MLVKMNEYLIEITKDVKKSFFITNLEHKLETLNFKINTSSGTIFIPQKDSQKVIAYYELKKSYHHNKNTKSVFLLLEIFYDINDKEYVKDECRSLQSFIEENDVSRFRKFFYEKIKDLDFVDKVIILEDKYKFCLLQKSYMLIYDIENSMRSLITKTMTFQGKRNWYMSEIPEDILSEIRDDRKNLEVFGTDFSHLTKILFDRTENSNINNLLAMIENLTNCTVQDIQKIKEKAPKSNWKKYFSSIIIDSNENDIKKTFEEVSKMRNKIAHNNFDINDDFYDILINEVQKINIWIKNALSYIDKYSSETSQNRIMEMLSENNKKIIKKVNSLEESVSKFYTLKKDENIDSFLYKSFYYEDEVSKSYKCDYKCIRDIKFFIRLKKQILNDEKDLALEESEKHSDDLDELITQVGECPKMEEKYEGTDSFPELNEED